MFKGKNIICFGSENWEYPGFQQTIMRKLSTSNKILFINPLGSRKIKLHKSQIKIYIRKIKQTFAKKYIPSTNCLVCSPLIIPLVYNNVINRLNRHIVKYQLKKLIKKSNFNSYILWVGTPTAAFLLDLFDPEMLIYHAVDRYSEFSFVDRERIQKYEKIVAEKADVILCTSDAIKNDLVQFNPKTYTITHAVEFDHFYTAFSTEYIPPDIAKIPKPIIGYFGGLSERVNFHLIRKIAIRYPFANVVLLGKKLTDLNALDKLPNVHVLGFKEFKKLPYYLKHFDVCLIPYYVNELMKGVDPIKLREYLCLGKPIVSVDLPEVRKFENLIYIGVDEEYFLLEVGNALNENEKKLRDRRINMVKKDNWKNKMREIDYVLNIS